MGKLTPLDIKRVKGCGFLHNRGTEDEFSARIITENGVVTSEKLKRIQEAATKYGAGTISITSRMTYEIPGIKFDSITEFQEFIASENLETGGTGPRVRPVVSCKGTVCQYGNADTQGIAKKIHQDFYAGYRNVTLPHKFKIAVGGCPNNCVKPSLNDIGVVAINVPNYTPSLCSGCRKCGIFEACPVGAVSANDGFMQINNDICIKCGRCIDKCYRKAMNGGTKGFKVYIGGRWGKQIQHGTPLESIYTEEQLFEVIEMLILLYCENGKTGERFGSVVTNFGIEFFEKQLVSKEVMKRKHEIIGE